MTIYIKKIVPVEHSGALCVRVPSSNPDLEPKYFTADPEDVLQACMALGLKTVEEGEHERLGNRLKEADAKLLELMSDVRRELDPNYLSNPNTTSVALLARTLHSRTLSSMSETQALRNQLTVLRGVLDPLGHSEDKSLEHIASTLHAYCQQLRGATENIPEFKLEAGGVRVQNYDDAGKVNAMVDRITELEAKVVELQGKPLGKEVSVSELEAATSYDVAQKVYEKGWSSYSGAESGMTQRQLDDLRHVTGLTAVLDHLRELTYTARTTRDKPLTSDVELYSVFNAAASPFGTDAGVRAVVVVPVGRDLHRETAGLEAAKVRREDRLVDRLVAANVTLFLSSPSAGGVWKISMTAPGVNGVPDRIATPGEFTRALEEMLAEVEGAR